MRRIKLDEGPQDNVLHAKKEDLIAPFFRRSGGISFNGCELEMRGMYELTDLGVYLPRVEGHEPEIVVDSQGYTVLIYRKTGI
jgi:hypothetical protein